MVSGARWFIGVVLALGGCLPDGPSPTTTPLPTLPDGSRVELHDVALVWPLPPGTGPGSGDGFLGPILGCDDLAVFEALTRTDEPDALCTGLTVTAARLDPCVHEAGTDAVCQPQLRLILQPVIDGDARDASIHAFFAVPEREIARGIARLVELRQLRSFDGRGALGVHPLLVDVSGRVAVAAVINDVLAASTLEQFTQITVHGDDAAWTFEFRVFEDGAPSTGEAIQQHVLSPDPDVIGVSITPLGDHDDDFSLLLDDVAAREATPAQTQAAFDAAARVEHPDENAPGTIDCARCHTAAVARSAARARTPGLIDVDAFTSTRHDLTPTAVFQDAQFIHALAWRHADLAINPRVIHEAASSADLAEPLLVSHGALP
jgi:hypothetical protein